MSKKKRGLFGLGIIIGFIVGIFLAPKKGSEMRADAKKKICDAKENPKDVLRETIDDVKEKVADLKADLADDKIDIQESDIVVSAKFDDEGDEI